MAKGAGHARARPGHHARACSPPTRSSTPTALDAALRAATARRPSTGSTPTAACPPTTPCCCWPPAPPGSRPADDELAAAVDAVCADLARQLLADAEGATKDIAHRGASARPREDDAVEVGRAVARNNLVKCAIHGDDPNWGRVLAAVGTTDAAFEPDAARRRASTASGSAGAAPPARTATRSTCPAARSPSPSTCTPATRDGDGLDQRPHRRLRPRELGVLDMSRRTPATDALGRAGARPATLIEALPWLARFHGARSWSSSTAATR